MKKSVYSLVLMDSVIAEIDRLAYENNTNRSNMINNILAQYVSLTTPQDRMKQIFDILESSIRGRKAYKIESTGKNTSFMLKSAIRFKYNPVVNYCVRIYKNNENHFGCISAGVRTQNPVLVDAVNDFFEIFSSIERKYINFDKYKNIEFHKIEKNKLVRQFVVGFNSQIDDEMIGNAISLYIDVLDKSIKTYFSYIENGKNPINAIDEIYRIYLSKQKLII